MKTFTLQQIADAAKAVHTLNEGYDGEPICPRRFTNEVLDFLEKYGTPAEFHRKYPQYGLVVPESRQEPTDAEINRQENERERKKEFHADTDIYVGAWVKVVRGKKVPIGTEGKILSLKDAEYDGKKVTKVTLEDNRGRKHYTYTYNLG